MNCFVPVMRKLNVTQKMKIVQRTSKAKPNACDAVWYMYQAPVCKF